MNAPILPQINKTVFFLGPEASGFPLSSLLNINTFPEKSSL